MQCAKCGAENPERAKFCIECASSFTCRCPSCNAENPPTAKFCLECAQPLQAGATAATTKTPSKGQEADGERRHLTVLFSELVNSTEIAARLDPEEWRDIAAQYQINRGSSGHPFWRSRRQVSRRRVDGLLRLAR